jgi:hypothetical protein
MDKVWARERVAVVADLTAAYPHLHPKATDEELVDARIRAEHEAEKYQYTIWVRMLNRLEAAEAKNDPESDKFAASPIPSGGHPPPFFGSGTIEGAGPAPEVAPTAPSVEELFGDEETFAEMAERYGKRAVVAEAEVARLQAALTRISRLSSNDAADLSGEIAFNAIAALDEEGT